MCITIIDLVHSHCNQASFHSTTLHYFALCYFTLHCSKLKCNKRLFKYCSSIWCNSNCIQAPFHSTTLHFMSSYITLHWNVTNVHSNCSQGPFHSPTFHYITLCYVTLQCNKCALKYCSSIWCIIPIATRSLSLWANSTGEHKVPWRKVKYWWKIIGVISMKCKKHSKAVR